MHISFENQELSSYPLRPYLTSPKPSTTPLYSITLPYPLCILISAILACRYFLVL